MFAYYIVPADLQQLGVLKFSPSVTSLIEFNREISSGNEEEVELRASSVHAVQEIRDLIHKISGEQVLNVELDLWLWAFGIQCSCLQHHQTLSIHYWAEAKLRMILKKDINVLTAWRRVKKIWMRIWPEAIDSAARIRHRRVLDERKRCCEFPSQAHSTSLVLDTLRVVELMLPLGGVIGARYRSTLLRGRPTTTVPVARLLVMTTLFATDRPGGSGGEGVAFGITWGPGGRFVSTGSISSARVRGPEDTFVLVTEALLGGLHIGNVIPSFLGHGYPM